MNSEQPTVRLATIEDVAAIAELTDLAYEKYVPRIGRKPQPMTTDYAQYLEQHPIWLLEIDREVAGLLALKNEPDALLIYSVAIQPAHQKRGFGRLLIDWAEAQARKANYQTIRLYTNAQMEENIALYTRLGYRETGRDPVGSGVRVNMSKTVEASYLPQENQDE